MRRMVKEDLLKFDATPGLRGRRWCRLHGGLSPGAPRQNGNFRNGDWTAAGELGEKQCRQQLVQANSLRLSSAIWPA